MARLGAVLLKLALRSLHRAASLSGAAQTFSVALRRPAMFCQTDLRPGYMPVPGEGAKVGNRGAAHEADQGPRRRRRRDDPHGARGHAM